MQSRIVIGVSILLVVVTGVLIIMSSSTALNAEFETAVQFVNAAGKGNDAAAFDLLSEDMQVYVTENCPDASVSACIRAYTPPEWGDFLNVVFRRSRPDDAAWDVLLIASYELSEGFSGVCIYNRVEKNAAGEWKIYGWSGYIACDDPLAGLEDLASNPDAPNRAP